MYHALKAATALVVAGLATSALAQERGGTLNFARYDGSN